MQPYPTRSPFWFCINTCWCWGLELPAWLFVFVFRLNQDVLPSLCPASFNQKEISLYCLVVFWRVLWLFIPPSLGGSGRPSFPSFSVHKFSRCVLRIYLMLASTQVPPLSCRQSPWACVANSSVGLHLDVPKVKDFLFLSMDEKKSEYLYSS